MLGNERLWSCTPVDPRFPPGEAEVWAAWLDVASEAQAGFWSTLSRPEQDRATRFVREGDRRRFVTARGVLRAILGARLGTEPQRVEFAYSAKGKPSLGGVFAHSGWQFNLAHSGDLAVFALARGGLVGVDVEQIRPVPDLPGLIKRFFSAREGAAIQSLSGEAQFTGFFRLWTRKEAWLKATGEGIAGPVASVEVLAPPGQPDPWRAPSLGGPGAGLRLHDLTPAPGFLGALATTPGGIGAGGGGTGGG